MNKDKGAAAMKACKAACIGCGKCEKECKFEAITISNNLSYIDFNKCRMCKKCVEACPTKAIHAVNFPAPKPKPVVEKAPETSEKADITAKVETKEKEAQA
jgi:ferredoxin